MAPWRISKSENQEIPVMSCKNARDKRNCRGRLGKSDQSKVTVKVEQVVELERVRHAAQNNLG